MGGLTTEDLEAELEECESLRADLDIELEVCQSRMHDLETKLERLRQLEADVKTIVLYLPGAMDEALACSESRFTRDVVAEAGARILEALADD